jgi:hypothetical protein
MKATKNEENKQLEEYASFRDQFKGMQKLWMNWS